MHDLSHELHTGMPVYPGDPDVKISPALTLEADGVAVTSVRIGSHSGTHIDAPAHTVVGGRTIDQVAWDELVGEALVIHVDRVSGPVVARQALGPEHLGLDALATAARAPGTGGARLPAIVAIATGWSRYFGQPEYLEHPFVTPQAAEQLWALGMRVLAIDTLSPDPTPSADFPVHEIVLGRDGLIVENLAGLQMLGARARLGFFPLKLGPVDGAPVRAVAFESSEVGAAAV